MDDLHETHGVAYERRGGDEFLSNL
jgi:hypothetical protein